MQRVLTAVGCTVDTRMLHCRHLRQLSAQEGSTSLRSPSATDVSEQVQSDLRQEVSARARLTNWV